ncbi:MAG: hypothetical protein R3339_08020 [Thermodesulfobacteriota bacterium]|nr:hypothetical protein [Thermodesulfobacteriota bacterium]
MAYKSPERLLFAQAGLVGQEELLPELVRGNYYNCTIHFKEIAMNLYVCNLALNVSENDLQQAFEALGEVESVKIIKDRYSGESRGFGFVEMPSGAEAQSAMNGLNGTEFKGLTIKVNQARPNKNKPRRNFRRYN